MKTESKRSRAALPAALLLAGLLSACASAVNSSKADVALTGANEVPAVVTYATGNASFTVDRDWTVNGRLTTSGIDATVAHIHEGRQGANGPVIIPLVRSGPNEWTVAPGTRLTDSQFRSYRAGGLYVNVHSANSPNGEIRGQLTP